MRILDRLLNRTSSYSQMSFVLGHEPPKNPQDKLGDPLAALSSELIERDYRTKINRGELALPMWALHEAIRLCPQLGNYQRLWIDSLTGMDWSIKEVADPTKPEGSKDETEHEQKSKRQAETLRKAYEGVDIVATIRHLALANLYGHSFLVIKGGRLEPLNWWNFARVGLYGAWKWNPMLRVQDGRNLPDAPDLDLKDYVFREVEESCLLEYLRLYLRFREVEGFWDDNLEKESKRQVVIIPGQLNNEKEANEFKEAARGIAGGGSGCLAGGSGDKPTQVLFPPESRGLPYYENRLKMLDELACKVLFGAPLIANVESGSGTLAGGAHSETADKRIQAAAMDISAALQKHFDRNALTKTGLIQPGETPLAYFELVDRKAVDPDKEIQWTNTLKTAGWDRDVDELGERAGMKLVKATIPDPAMSRASMWNRDGTLLNFDPRYLKQHGYVNRSEPDRGSQPPPGVLQDCAAAGILPDWLYDTRPQDLVNRASDELGVPSTWLAPVRNLLMEIVEKAEGGQMTDEDLVRYVEQAARRVPELFGEMDVEAFAKLLEGIAGASAVEGVRDALRS